MQPPPRVSVLVRHVATIPAHFQGTHHGKRRRILPPVVRPHRTASLGRCARHAKLDNSTNSIHRASNLCRQTIRQKLEGRRTKVVGAILTHAVSHRSRVAQVENKHDDAGTKGPADHCRAEESHEAETIEPPVQVDGHPPQHSEHQQSKNTPPEVS